MNLNEVDSPVAPAPGISFDRLQLELLSPCTTLHSQVKFSLEYLDIMIPCFAIWNVVDI